MNAKAILHRTGDGTSSKRLALSVALSVLGLVALTGISDAQDIQIPQGTFQIGPLKFQVGPPLPPENTNAPSNQTQAESQTQAQIEAQAEPLISTIPPDRLPRRYQPLFEPFDARNLTAAEQWALQFTLTLTGHYQGLMDGQWGRMSQTAFTKFSQSEYQQDPLNIHAVDLAGQMQNEIRKNGWRYVNDQTTRYNFLLPLALMDGQSKRGQQAGIRVWNSNKTSLSVSTRLEDNNAVNIGHRRLLSGHRGGEAPLSVRRDGRYITSIIDQRGIYTYVRSERAGARWRSIVMTANADDKALFNLAVASIKPGNPPAVGIASGTYLERMIDLTTQYAAYSPPAAPVEPRTPSGVPNNQDWPIATGVFINDQGFVITNASMVSDCDYIIANGYNMSIKARFDDMDLAILEPEENVYNVSAIKLSEAPANERQRVFIASGFSGGYLSDDMTILRGTVASKFGSQENPYLMQVATDLPPDFVGAPIMSRSGTFLGLMKQPTGAQFASLDGRNPNAGFDVVKGDLIKILLDSHDVEFEQSAINQPKSTPRLKDDLSSAFAAVECVR